MTARHVLLYADVDLNVIDGSSIWVASVADALHRAGARVDVLARSAVTDFRVTAPLVGRDGITIVDPGQESLVVRGRRMDPAAAAAAVDRLDQAARYDAVIVRGREVCRTIAAEQVASGKLWSYLTDIPQSALGLGAKDAADLTAIAEWSVRILCQTEQLKGFLERIVPAVAGKTVLLPPIVPAEAFTTNRPSTRGDTLQLVYSGKYAPRWRTLEMCSIPGDLQAAGLDARLTMIGDKIHSSPTDPEYKDRMRKALESSPGVVWAGGVARSEALAAMGAADIALAWRDPDLDSSLELSTKLLEFGALGVPTVLNRTPMHEELVGTDYPLFVDTYESVLEALTIGGRDDESLQTASKRLSQVAANFSADEAAKRLAAVLDEIGLRRSRTLGRTESPETTVLVAGHDLKFFKSIMSVLGDLGDVTLTVDRWKGVDRHDAALSAERLRDADVVVCEWTLGNAVWYSHNKRPGQRLVARLHRIEIETTYPSDIDADAVDAIVCVGPHMAGLVSERFGLPAEKIVVVPNAIDHASFVRPKRPGAEFVLGMVGVLPALKRLDLAFDLVKALRTYDSRFMLRVKSTPPWGVPWVWKRESERDYFAATMRRLSADSDLAEAVVFDPPGADVAEWFRGVGWITSMSDFESFHLAAAEGMASGAVPLIRTWPGADSIYGGRWLHEDVDAMAAQVLATLEDGSWQRRGAEASADVARFDLNAVAAAWTDVLAGRDVATGPFWPELEGNA
ncbi:glycosyltransferase family 4 protein [Jiangella sp. DSM 45060]|uniref:glycosyltransferase family 4 protein n=1 Tax=Jiangella sp. DSM 45060 TaxID=1798224 RepID=UPI00087B995B|nr:glycosyltransferase family 4 protein [Jiangella sp. DSM 45060]SDS15229.1 Glycosyl transferases group 1 [Jiangella sp. DSM 45060]